MFSIIIPCYKCEKTISRCLDSIVSQSYKDYEIIIIIDGVYDNTLDICREYKTQYKNIDILIQDNQGVSVARNNGLLCSKGEYVIFVDADDYMVSDCLRELASHIDDNSDIVIEDFCVENNKGLHASSFFQNNISMSSDLSNYKEDLLISCLIPYGVGKNNQYCNVGVPWAKMYRRRFLLENNIFFKPGLKRMQDCVFNLYAILNAKRVSYLPVNCYVYVKNIESATEKYSNDFENTIIILDEEFLRFGELCNIDSWQDVLQVKQLYLLEELINLKYINNKDSHSIMHKLADLTEDSKMIQKYISFRGWQANALLSRHSRYKLFAIDRGWYLLCYCFYYTKALLRRSLILNK